MKRGPLCWGLDLRVTARISRVGMRLYGLVLGNVALGVIVGTPVRRPRWQEPEDGLQPGDPRPWDLVAEAER